MDNLSNLQVIQQMYKSFAEGNIQAVLSFFDKNVVWVRPGEPDIPFSGTFNGFEGLAKMFAIMKETIKLKSFVPEKFYTNDDTVVVEGNDIVEVIATGKFYSSDWVQCFTFSNGKIIYVQVYMDTLKIANAFQV